jgi:cytochrome c-type protein NapB
MKKLMAFIVAAACLSSLAFADNVATLRGSAELADQNTTENIAKVENKDIKRKRNYPMQPPTIPHKTDNYQVDLKTNKCMSCHDRKHTEDSQAPAVSVTHYMDRDGNFLAAVSPRRYFCDQCHVVQTDAKPLVDNTFKDIDDILKRQPNRQ